VQGFTNTDAADSLVGLASSQGLSQATLRFSPPANSSPAPASTSDVELAASAGKVS
jgi:hypothetical protein